jgi:hypothetical protein
VRLQPLFDKAGRELSADGKPMEWAQFYPVVKILIAQNLKYSLVQTYQHKYTLHRCVSTMAACLFWLIVLSLVVSVAAVAIPGPGPNWAFLMVLAIACLCLASMFSRSYTYFWTMWGNTIVTEGYSLTCMPRIEGGLERKK